MDCTGTLSAMNAMDALKTLKTLTRVPVLNFISNKALAQMQRAMFAIYLRV